MIAPVRETSDLAGLAPPAGSRILLVGGCGAIGRSLISLCSRLDHRIAVFALERSLKAHPVGRGVLTFSVDATDEGSVREGLEQLQEHWDAVDILVFLVGFMTVPPCKIDALAVEEWDAVVRGNLRSAYIVSRLLLPMLRNSEDPSIVMVGSSLAYNPLPGVAPYAAAKAGLVALTKSLAVENAPQIRVNLVAPSAVQTGFLAGGGGERGALALEKGGDTWFREMTERYIPTIPLGRIATPADVVGPVLFLAGPGASFITGQVLHVNGGRITP
jgi:NAD(P)-dependent dehydrogenase (short-subunit alcohol dehydrogenase family)